MAYSMCTVRGDEKSFTRFSRSEQLPPFSACMAHAPGSFAYQALILLNGIYALPIAAGSNAGKDRALGVRVPACAVTLEGELMLPWGG